VEDDARRGHAGVDGSTTGSGGGSPGGGLFGVDVHMILEMRRRVMECEDSDDDDADDDDWVD